MWLYKFFDQKTLWKNKQQWNRTGFYRANFGDDDSFTVINFHWNKVSFAMAPTNIRYIMDKLLQPSTESCCFCTWNISSINQLRLCVWSFAKMSPWTLYSGILSYLQTREYREHSVLENIKTFKVKPRTDDFKYQVCSVLAKIVYRVI